MKTELRKCSVCGGGHKEILYTQEFETISEGALLNGYDVVSCADCGHCFADNLPPQEHFDWYYKEMSKYEAPKGTQVESKYDLSRLETIAKVFVKYLGKADEKILEVGASTGKFLSILKAHGFQNLTATDPSPNCAETAKQLYGIDSVACTLGNMPFPDGLFDNIILIGVLEHIKDLENSIHALGRLVKSDGKVLICVPDASRYMEGEDAPFQEFSVEHINFFGPHSLRNLMGKFGFFQIGAEQGMVEANYRTLTPVLYGVYQKISKTVGAEMAKDAETTAGLKKYVEQSFVVNNRIKTIIDSVVKRDIAILVWGAGAHTLRLLATTSLRSAKILAFVDSNPRYQGKLLVEKTVIPPERIRDYSAPILISSRIYEKEIRKLIREKYQCANETVLLYDI